MICSGALQFHIGFVQFYTDLGGFKIRSRYDVKNSAAALLFCLTLLCPTFYLPKFIHHTRTYTRTNTHTEIQTHKLCST